jgi:uncharacterized protein
MNLYGAAQAGSLERVKLLVEQGEEKDDPFEVRKKTALIAAAENGHLDVVRFLVEQGADMEKADSKGWTPLHYERPLGGGTLPLRARGG